MAEIVVSRCDVCEWASTMRRDGQRRQDKRRLSDCCVWPSHDEAGVMALDSLRPVLVRHCKPTDLFLCLSVFFFFFPSALE